LNEERDSVWINTQFRGGALADWEQVYAYMRTRWPTAARTDVMRYLVTRAKRELDVYGKLPEVPEADAERL